MDTEQVKVEVSLIFAQRGIALTSELLDAAGEIADLVERMIDKADEAAFDRGIEYGRLNA